MTEMLPVYKMTEGERRLLGELQGEVIKCITWMMAAKGVRFDPALHAVDWEHGEITMKMKGAQHAE